MFKVLPFLLYLILYGLRIVDGFGQQLLPQNIVMCKYFPSLFQAIAFLDFQLIIVNIQQLNSFPQTDFFLLAKNTLKFTNTAL